MRALYEAPFTVPLNPAEVFVGVGVAVLVGVGVGVAVALCVGAAVAVAIGFAVAVALIVGVGAAVAVAEALAVADGLALAVAAASGVATGVDPPRSVPPPNPTVPVDWLSAGGVIESTAPNPVTVPAAINSAFFISVLSLPTLRFI